MADHQQTPEAAEVTHPDRPGPSARPTAAASEPPRQPDSMDPRRPAAEGSGTGPVLVACGLGVLGVVAAASVGALRATQPRLLGRANPDPITSVLHAMVGASAWLALVATLALLCLATVLGPRRPLWDPTRRVARPAWRMSQVWMVLALVMVPLEAADTSGLPVGSVLADLPTHLTATPSVTAWFVTAVLALVVAMTCLVARNAGAHLGAALITVVAAVPVIVTGPVSVGLDHDFSTDSGALAGLGLVVAGAAVLARLLGPAATAPARAARTHGAVVVGAATFLVGHLVDTWQGLAGTSVLASDWGRAQLVSLVAAAVLTLLAVLPAWRWSTVVQALAATTCLTLLGASSQLVPPRFLLPQTAQVNYLGYPVPPRPDAATLASPDRPNILFSVLAVAGVVSYLMAVRTLHRRGRRWPVGRTVGWLSGWVVVAYLATAGLWQYSSVMFSWHMLVHMTFNMLVPALLVLGAPVTLLRAVLPGDGPLMDARACVDDLLNWRPTRLLFGPFAAWIVFVSSFYIVYFTPVFGYLMRYHWGHQWMLLHFMFAGFMLFEYVIGIDELPASLPHIGRLGFVITAMPFHSFFAVITMNAHQIIGSDYYRTLEVPWVHSLADDQNLGGQITWATGEIPMALVLIALCIQWFLSDRRDQRRVDSGDGEDLDASLAAYNEMLARMAGQSSGPAVADRRAVGTRVEAGRADTDSSDESRGDDGHGGRTMNR